MSTKPNQTTPRLEAALDAAASAYADFGLACVTATDRQCAAGIIVTFLRALLKNPTTSLCMVDLVELASEVEDAHGG